MRLGIVAALMLAGVPISCPVCVIQVLQRLVPVSVFYAVDYSTRNTFWSLVSVAPAVLLVVLAAYGLLKASDRTKLEKRVLACSVIVCAAWIVLGVLGFAFIGID